MDPHGVQALGLQEEKVLVLEMWGNNLEEVCWGRKADGAGTHEETRAVLEGTGARDGVEPAESGAAGKHPRTQGELLQQSLLSVPHSGVATLRNNDTAAVRPFSHSSPLSAACLLPLQFHYFRFHVTSYRSSPVPAPCFLFPV